MLVNRHRERNSLILVQGGRLVTYRADTGGIVSQYGPATSTINFVEKMDDIVDEDYFAKVRNGDLLPVNPMSHEGTSLSYGEVSDEVNLTLGTWVCSSTTASGALYRYQVWSDFSPYWNAAGNRSALTPGIPGSCGTTPDAPPLAYMLQEARAKCHSEGSGMDLLTMLAEMDKSVDLLSDVHTRTLSRARRVIDAATRIRKGDLNPMWRKLTRASKVADLLNIASSLWLEHRFGWRLLVQDIESLKEVWDRQDSFGKQLIRGTFQYTDQSSPIVTSLLYDRGSAAIQSVQSTLWGRYTYRAEKLVRRTLRVGTMEKFANANPFFGDPVTTLWELVPLSWVVDVFTNVGSAIKAWSPIVSGVPVHHWMTDEVTHINRRVMIPTGGYTVPKSNTYTITSGEPLVAEVGTRYYSRAPVQLQMPVSYLSLKPQIQNTKIHKWMDVGSVVAQFGNNVVQHCVSNIKRNLS